MYRPRLIPVLLIENNYLIKTKKFKEKNYIGDPINAVKIFNDLEADEIFLLDIYASSKNNSISIELVKEVGEEANMPFCVGGGIKSINQIREILKNGAEKVVLGNEAAKNPNFISEASEYFGSSTIAVCVDYRTNIFGKQECFYNNGKNKLKINIYEYIKKIELLGAGEIILQCVDRDGMRNGYDINFINKVQNKMNIPLVAVGGASNIKDFKTLNDTCKVNGIAAGSFFVYHGDLDGVLINYPKKEEVREIFDEIK